MKWSSVYLVIYLGTTMALSTASVCLTVLVLNFHYRTSHARVPNWARLVFLVHFARVLGISTGSNGPLAQPPPRLRSKRRESTVKGRGGAGGGGGVGGFAIPTMNSSLRRGTAPPSQNFSFCDNLLCDHYLFSESQIQYHKIDPSRLTEYYSMGSEAGLWRKRGAQEGGNGGVVAEEDVVGSWDKRGVGSRRTTIKEPYGRGGGGGGVESSGGVSPCVDPAMAGLSDSCEERQEDMLKEWQLLARVMDRIFFFVVSFLMLGSAVLILSSPWYSAAKVISTPS